MITTELQEYIKREIAKTMHIPVGAIFAFPSEKIPQGFLPCEGQELSCSQYPLLFDLIGNTFGGKGKTFCLPDLQGQFIRGLDREGNVDCAEEGKIRTVGSFQEDTLQGHRHIGGETNKGGSHKHKICFESDRLQYGTNTFSDNEKKWVYEPYDYSEDDDELDFYETNQIKSHTHKFQIGEVSDDSYGKVRISSETRPKNVSMIFCIKVC